MNHRTTVVSLPRAALYALAAMLVTARPLAAQSAPVARAAPPADRVPAHESFTVTSKALGEPRLVNVYTPAAYRGADSSSARRFPVLYMPDGGLDEDFPHVVNTVDSLIALGVIRPVIVVGIPNTQRRRDLTGPTRVAADSAIAPRVGGSAAFRQFLREELIPAVAARYRTTGQRAIVGESLAGLFVVETFLLEPALFDRYVALDPSLGWDRRSLVDSLAPLRLAAMDGRKRRLFLASSNTPEIAAPTARLAKRLGAARRPGLSWSYEPRLDLTHATIFRAIAPKALAAVLE